MFVLFNGSIIPDHELKISIYDRGFQYGDGIFETMFATNGRIRNMANHLDRLKRGCKALEMTSPDTDVLEELLEKLLLKNRLEEGRLKLLVWRKAGGAYQPTSHDANVLAYAVGDTWNPFKSADKAGICMSARKQVDRLSPYKTMSALCYVKAALEMQERGLDEIILLNQAGHLCEGHNSNLFWYSEGTFFTPADDTGLVQGTMRKSILRYLKDANIPVTCPAVYPNELDTADVIFTANASGITYIHSLDSLQVSNSDLDKVTKILTPLLQP